MSDIENIDREDVPETVRTVYVRRAGLMSRSWLLSEQQDGPAFGLWKTRVLKEAGRLLLGERRYELDREGLAGDFVMRRRGHRALRATKPSAFSHRINVRGHGRQLELRSTLFRRGLEVREHASRIGHCRPPGWFTSQVALEVNRDLPVELAVFSLWMSMLMIERDQSNSS